MTDSTTSLRERKKAKTKSALRQEALRLFLEHGYEATTIDDIVNAAEVSQSTFFRYFPTKEDVILESNYQGVILETLLARIMFESPVEAMWSALRAGIDTFYEADRAVILDRMKLMYANPALVARALANLRDFRRKAAAAVAEKIGADSDDLAINVGLAVAMTTLMTAVEHWQQVDGTVDLAVLLDECRNDLGAWVIG